MVLVIVTSLLVAVKCFCHDKSVYLVRLYMQTCVTSFAVNKFVNGIRIDNNLQKKSVVKVFL